VPVASLAHVAARLTAINYEHQLTARNSVRMQRVLAYRSLKAQEL